jgi:hypothetical protein
MKRNIQRGIIYNSFLFSQLVLSTYIASEDHLSLVCEIWVGEKCKEKVVIRNIK